MPNRHRKYGRLAFTASMTLEPPHDTANLHLLGIIESAKQFIGHYHIAFKSVQPDPLPAIPEPKAAMSRRVLPTTLHGVFRYTGNGRTTNSPCRIEATPWRSTLLAIVISASAIMPAMNAAV